jgi:predicted DCC family thiol-disulfide oxidoreductase YuxK
MGKEKGTVYYDGECKFCATSVGLLKDDGEDSAEYKPYQDTQDLPEGLTPQSAENQLWLVMPDGRKYGGFFAVRRLAWRKPWMWPIALLLWLPGMDWLGPKVYRWVARNRRKLWGAKRP